MTLPVWTLCHVLPYHMRALYEQYKVGYGVVCIAPPSADSSASTDNIRQDLKVSIMSANTRLTLTNIACNRIWFGANAEL